MADPLARPSLLSPEGLQSLRSSRKQLVELAAGKLSEHLVWTTVAAAMRCTEAEEALPAAWSAKVAALVRMSLRALERDPGRRPSTRLELARLIGLRRYRSALRVRPKQV